jgi:hypothetical protein
MLTVNEFKELNRGRYDGLTKEVRKGGGNVFTYIPWWAMCDQLDRVLGEDGWSAEVVAGGIHYDPADRAYAVAVNLEIYLWDEDHHILRTIKRPGIGVEAIKYEGVDGHDAAKGARSDALVVAARTLGDLFGRFLSNRENGRTETPGEHRAGGTQEASATEKQIKWLTDLGATPGVLAGLTRSQAGAILDRVSNKNGKFGRRYPVQEACAEVLGEKHPVASGHSDDF